MTVDGYGVADNGYGDDKVVLSFELILTLTLTLMNNFNGFNKR